MGKKYFGINLGNNDEMRNYNAQSLQRIVFISKQSKNSSSIKVISNRNLNGMKQKEQE